MESSGLVYPNSNDFSAIWNLYLKKNRFPAHCIFHMDKTEVYYAPNKILKVISSKGICIVFKMVSVERGQTVTVICCKCPPPPCHNFSYEENETRNIQGCSWRQYSYDIR
jgi:hypothetical protein